MKRLLLVLSLSFLACSAGASTFNHNLSLADRIAYQKVMDEVFWKHTIWPASNPQPKPTLRIMISDSEIRSKVEQYLIKSEALASFWHRPITPEQMQAEMDRMARETQDARLLREIWKALGDDPYVIAECFARPILVARISERTNGFHAWWKQQQNQFIHFTSPAHHEYRLPRLDPALPISNTLELAANSWKATTTSGAPSERTQHVAVWTGTEMLIWGGWNNVYHGDGARYSPATNSWTAITATGAPIARAGHTGVWSGTELIVWGGFQNTKVLKSGARYNPLTDTWIATKETGAPAPRYYHTAVWTGTEMIVWGGGGKKSASVLKSGGRYNPTTDSWTSTKKTGAPAGRAVHTAVWTGTEMIVWGGHKFLVSGGATTFNTGGRYNPTTNTWSPTSLQNAPYQRSSHTAVWSGDEMIIFGGSSNIIITQGGSYDPSTNTWSSLPTAKAPSSRSSHTAIWTGTRMIIWGGTFGNPLKTGALYNPVSHTWSSTKVKGAPSGRSGHTAVWTGEQMIIWGGYSTKDLKTGGRYTP